MSDDKNGTDALFLLPNLVDALDPSQYITWHPVGHVKICCSVHDGKPKKGVPLKELVGTLEVAQATATVVGNGTRIGHVFFGNGPILVDADRYKATPESDADTLIGEVLAYSQSFIEYGPRGEGSYHLWGLIDDETRALMGSGRVTEILGCIDILADNCFATLTGQAYRDVPVADISKLVRHLLSLRTSTGAEQVTIGSEETELIAEYDANARVDLEGFALVNTISKRSPRFMDRLTKGMEYLGHPVGGKAPRWHREFSSLLEEFIAVGATRRNTYNILANSEFVALSYAPASDGGNRLAKLKRLMLDNPGTQSNWWDKSVVSWMRKRAAVADGRSLAASMGIGMSPPAQEVPPLPPPTKFSPMAIRAVQRLTDGIVEDKYLQETLPPGLIGEFTGYVYQGMYEPFLKFAIPATLSTTTALTGRYVKLPNDQGINLMMLVCAMSATGKSESARSVADLLNSLREDEAFARMPDYINSVSVDSRQGGHHIFQNTPSMLWNMDECAAMLDMVVNPPKGSSASAVSDLLNKLFELSTINGILRRPGSRIAERQGEYDIPNPNISCYWATTTSNASKIISRAFIDSGLSSRVLPILHHGSAGQSHEDLSKQLLRLPEGRVRERLKQLVTESMECNVAYASAVLNGQRWSPEVLGLIKRVGMTPDAQAVFERFRKASDQFKYDVQDDKGGFPDTYIMLSRVAMHAPRIAACAVYFNESDIFNAVPRIGVHELKWSIGYVLKQYAGFLTGFDRNIFGASLGQAELTVITAIRELLATGEAASVGAVSKMQLGRKCADRAPFRSATDPRDALWRTVKELIDEGALEVGKSVDGRQGTFYKPTEHRIWRDA